MPRKPSDNRRRRLKKHHYSDDDDSSIDEKGNIRNLIDYDYDEEEEEAVTDSTYIDDEPVLKRKKQQHKPNVRPKRKAAIKAMRRIRRQVEPDDSDYSDEWKMENGFIWM